MQSLDVEGAKEWADEGLFDLNRELIEFDLPLDDDTFLRFLRAAYGRGYCDALAEAEPPILTEVFERVAILDVLLPVE